MTAYETEEKIEILSYVIDTLDTSMSYLEAISVKDDSYSLYVAQMMEMCTTLEVDRNNLIMKLDEFAIEELQ